MTAILALVAAAFAVHAPVGPLPCALFAATAPAAPQVDGIVDSVTTGIVDGVIAGTPDELRLLRDVLGDSLSRQGLVLDLKSADRIIPDDVTRTWGTPGQAAARFRLDLTSPPIAKLYLTNGDRSRIHVRWLSLARGLDPVAIELVRFVIESSIDEIRAGRSIGVSREEYEASIGKPATEQPSPIPDPPLHLVAAAAYEGTLLGGGHHHQGPGLSLSARLPRLWVGADVFTRLPTTIGDDVAGARLAVHGFRVSATLPVLNARPLTLALGSAAGIDATQIRPRISQPDLTAAPPFWATTPILRVFAAVEYLLGRLSVGAIVGLDVDLLGERYLVADTNADREAFVPWRFRPVAAITLGLRR